MQPFDLAQCTLQGHHLIEASAGTGKTYTLVNLYLRVLFERELLPEDILVVTFTEAATQELMQRLRKGLRVLKNTLYLSEDSALYSEALGKNTELLDILLNTRSKQEIAKHIETVTQNFDAARISTIHGFCQKSLQQYALHTGQPFRQELESDVTERMLQCVADFWRQRFYEEVSAEQRQLLGHLLSKNITPVELTKNLKPAFENEELPCFPEFETLNVVSLTDFENTFATLLKNLRVHWNQESAALKDTLTESIQAGHFKQAYGLDRLVHALDVLQPLLSSEEGEVQKETGLADLIEQFCQEETYASLEALGTDCLEKCLRKNKPSPVNEHAFFEVAQQTLSQIKSYQQSPETLYLLFQHELIAHVRQQLKEDKARAQVLTFDDLLKNLAKALNENSFLAKALHKDCPVAFIDEFQDTDTWQYQIFETIYAEGDIFFIGDPKQAIYSFRGADIDVYLKARSRVPETQQWTLSTNYRSTPDYVTAINDFYTSLNPLPFGNAGIAYHKVNAKSKASQTSEAALKLWYQPVPEGSKSWTATDFTPRLLHALAENVQQELENVSAEDIVILVRKHSQSQQVARVLRKRNIPVIVHNKHSVFDTPEAQDMVLFLEGVLYPRESLGAALSSRSLGLTAQAIYSLKHHNESEWVEKIEQCQTLRERWRKLGFSAMWNGFVEAFDVYLQALQYQDGERVITNFRHLANLIQAEEQERQLTVEHTLHWLRQNIKNPQSDQENQMLHLESERSAVQIMTLHNSKGLEYDVVFCPFLWKDSTPRQKTPLYAYSFIDLGPEDMKQRADNAKRAYHDEEMRLTYVGLTRAKKRCHIYWGHVSRNTHSPLKYLLEAKDTALDKLNALHQKETIQAALFLDNPAKKYTEEAPANSAKLSLAKTPYQVPPAYEITSFTHLAKRHEDGADQAEVSPLEDDSQDAQENTEHPLLYFPRGAESGIFLHSVLEHLHLSRPVAEQSETLARQLQMYGIDSSWNTLLPKALQQILNTPLFSHANGPTLASFDPEHSLKEWDFDLYLPSFSADLKSAGQPRYLTGSIDLVFCYQNRYYIVDYKSNDLGSSLSHYAPDYLSEAITEHQYSLQYTLYTLALHLYLKSTRKDYNYADHFGGCYYLFLRGMHPDIPGNGIFSARPEFSEIEKLHQHWTQL